MEKKRKHWRKIIFLLLATLAITIIFSTSIGAVKIPFWDVLKLVTNRIPILSNLIEVEDVATWETIILMVRLPRVLVAGLVGFALATSGTIFQGLLKNPMADPYIIGISSGASLGAALVFSFNLNFSYANFNTLPLFAFIGALLTGFLVYYLARKGGKVPVATLLLAGIAVSSFLSAIVSLLMFFNDESLNQIVYWMMGSLASASWSEFHMIWIYILPGFLASFFLAREINLMLLGEDSAQSLGVEIEKLKQLLLVVASLLAGAAVAVSGIIGFVGLIIPHITRLLVGPDHRILIPASALGGAIFLVATDTLARTLLAPTELPVGIITALFGAPFFLYLLRKNSR